MATITEVERMVVRIIGDASSYISVMVSVKASTTTAQRSILSLASSVELLEKKLVTSGAAIASAGRRISLFLSTAVAGVGYLAAKAGADFEQGFTGIIKTVNATSEQLQILRGEMKQLAIEVPLPISELLKIGQIAGQLGVEVQNIKEFTRVIGMLSVSTNLTSEQAATDLAKFANITRLPQEQFANLGSAIVALGNGARIANQEMGNLGQGTATTEKDIVALSMRLAAAGTTIGMTSPQILGMAAALSSVGLQAELGGTAMSRLFLEMDRAVANGTADLEIFAQTTGRSVEEFKSLFRNNATGAVVEFIKGLKRLNQEERVTALRDLKVEGIRLLDVLLRAANANDILDRAMKSSEQAFKDNNALIKEATLYFGTFNSEVQKTFNIVALAGEEAFQNMQGPLREMLKTIQNGATWFRRLANDTQQLIISSALLAAALGPVVFVIGNIVWSVGQLIRVLRLGKNSVVWLIELHKTVANLPWFRMGASAEASLETVSTSSRKASVSIKALMVELNLLIQKLIAAINNLTLTIYTLISVYDSWTLKSVQGANTFNAAYGAAMTRATLLTKAFTRALIENGVVQKRIGGPPSFGIGPHNGPTFKGPGPAGFIGGPVGPDPNIINGEFTVLPPKALGSWGSFSNLLKGLGGYVSGALVGAFKTLGAVLKFFTLELVLLAGYGIFKVTNAWANWAMEVDRFNKSLEVSKKLQSEMLMLDDNRRTARMKDVTGATDPVEQRKVINDKIKEAAVLMKTLQSQEESLNDELEKTNTYWNMLLLGSTYGVFGKGLAFIEDEQKQLEGVQERIAGVRAELHQYKNMLASLPGGKSGDSEEELKAKEAKKRIAEKILSINQETLKSTGKNIEKMEEEIQALGKTSKEVDLLTLKIQYWKLVSLGATEAVLKPIEKLIAKVGELHDKLDAAKLANDIKEFEKSLKKSLDTIGMSSEEITIFELKQRGATDEQIKQVKILAEQRKLQKEADAVNEKYKSPLQKLIEERSRLQLLFSKKLITADIFEAAVKEAENAFQKIQGKRLHWSLDIRGVQGVNAGSIEDIAMGLASKAYGSIPMGNKVKPQIPVPPQPNQPVPVQQGQKPANQTDEQKQKENESKFAFAKAQLERRLARGEISKDKFSELLHREAKKYGIKVPESTKGDGAEGMPEIPPDFKGADQPREKNPWQKSNEDTASIEQGIWKIVKLLEKDQNNQSAAIVVKPANFQRV